MKDLPRLADVLAARYNDVEALWDFPSSPPSFLANRHLTSSSTRSPFGCIPVIPTSPTCLVRSDPM